ncbi:diguanylate cyclase [Nakamurella deserti]|uniref:sensor domain-containing protein n=1 Tax=Nakamurella deserti TaxID=2164074 RepID=UPI001478859F|nr:diguanylate cyclase [Nakamurella deserti]
MSDPTDAGIDFEQVFTAMPSAVLVLDLDLVIVDVNQTYLTLLHRSRADLVGRHVFAAFPPPTGGEIPSPLERSFRRVLDTGRSDVMPMHRYDVADPGSGVVERRFWSTVNAAVPGADGRPALILHKVEDVTAFVELIEDRLAGPAPGSPDTGVAEQAVAAELYLRMQELHRAREAETAAVAALQASEARARAILDTAVDAIVIFDRAGLVESMNRSAECMFGRSAPDTAGLGITALIVPPDSWSDDDPEPLLERIDRRAAAVGEMRGRRSDGTVFPIELAISDAGPGTDLFTAVVRDISERKRLEAQLAYQSVHDPLTGLANRRQVRPRLEHEVARMNRHPGVLAVLFIDLDGFKAVNDTLGHSAGDELLVAVADRLRLGCRSEDLVARFGGDEFVVVCAEMHKPEEALVIAERLDALLGLPVEIAGQQLRPRASIGIVTDDGRRTPDQLLDAADAAMYRVKRGRATAG